MGSHFEFYRLEIFQDAFSPETLQIVFMIFRKIFQSDLPML